MSTTWWLEAGQLDEYQKEIYTLGITDSYLIVGPPGSGKTNLILLRAKYLVAKQLHNIQILVFTKALKNFLLSGGNKYGLGEVNILTFNRFIKNKMMEYNIPISDTGEFLLDRVKNAELLEKYLIQNKITGDFDTILIDEAQDCLPIEIRIFKRLCNRLYCVADMKQKIYGGDSPIEELKKYCILKELIFHYRNGIEICKLADRIAKHTENYVELTSTSHYREDLMQSSVNLVQCKNEIEQFVKIEMQLSIQLKAYPDEFIGIITPNNKDLSRVVKYFANTEFANKIAIANSDNNNFDLKMPIIISNMHNSKGLEFRAVHICNFDSMESYKQTNRNLTYTSVTRAKTTLNIYYIKFLYPYFRQAITNLNDQPYDPTDEDIFGSKK